MRKIIIITALLLGGFVWQANAQTTTPKVTKKQVTQQARIQDGKKNGELTRAEKRQLQREQRRIQKHKRMARADGKVTRRERAILRKEQRRADRNIYRKKHNRRDRN